MKIIMETTKKIVKLVPELVEAGQRFLEDLWDDVTTEYLLCFPYCISDSGHEASENGSVPSVTGPNKIQAVTFICSDVTDPKKYTDTGIRYEFKISRNGIKYAREDNSFQVLEFQGSQEVAHLPEEHALNGENGPIAISYTKRRTGEVFAMRECDLLAAGGGRIFVKEKGRGRFYFTAMQDEFMHFGGKNRNSPGFYIKMDPEYNRTRRGTDPPPIYWWESTYHFHPQAERYPGMLDVKNNLLPDWLLIRVFPKVWHLLDTRPPFGLRFDETREIVDPPVWVKSYDHVTYKEFWTHQRFTQKSIEMKKVLDIGVGHMHWHQGYERSCGGEIDALKEPNMLGLYQLFNGPVADRGGFCDGTCNFYVLAKIMVDPNLGTNHTRECHAILFRDEQSYFSERWHLLSPMDGKRMPFIRDWALAGGAGINSGQSSGDALPSFNSMFYKFDPRDYWCPFADEWAISPTYHFDDSSKMVVAKQIIMVTGNHFPKPLTDSRVENGKSLNPEIRDHPVPADNDEKPVIFSINFSWGTMDRTWRWRYFPNSDGNCIVLLKHGIGSTDQQTYEKGKSYCYHDTLQLRDDLTILVQGVKWIDGGQADAGEHIEGYWYQKYLPAECREVPVNPMYAPSIPYQHGWHFISKENFKIADSFSHFGVYEDVVDSRRQYYPLKLEKEHPETTWVPWREIADFLKVEVKLPDIAQGLNLGSPVTTWRQLLEFCRILREPPLRIDDLLLEIISNATDTVSDFLDRTLPNDFPFGPKTYAPPSKYNEGTYFRLLNRGKHGWLAVYWDKRDDELAGFTNIPFEGRDVKLDSKPEFANLDLTTKRSISVRIMPQQVNSMPPVVQVAKIVVNERKKSVLLLFYSSMTSPPWPPTSENYQRPIQVDTQDFPPFVPPIVHSPLLSDEYSWLHDDIRRYLESHYHNEAPYDSRSENTGAKPDTSIWRMKVGILKNGCQVLCNLEVPQVFKRISAHLFSFSYSEDDEQMLQEGDFCDIDSIIDCCANLKSAMSYGTSVWFEDITGHVGLPEHVLFSREAR